MSLIALYSFPVLVVAQPEWQSQYAIGKNKLAPHTYYGLMRMLMLWVKAIMSNHLTI